MTKEGDIGIYFALFHGEEIRLGIFEKHAKKYLAAVDALMAQGEVVGQRCFFIPPSQSKTLVVDMMLIMPSKLKKEEVVDKPKKWYD